MFEHGPGDRLQVLGLGDLRPPGTCLHCGSGNCELGYVTLDVFRDYEGETYLCMTCCKQLAELIGCLIPEEAEVLQRDHFTTQALLNTTSKALEDANARLANYDSLLRHAVSTGRIVIPDMVDSDASEAEPVKSGAEPDLLSLIDSGESESKESVTDEGSLQPTRDERGDKRKPVRRNFSL